MNRRPAAAALVILVSAVLLLPGVVWAQAAQNTSFFPVAGSGVAVGGNAAVVRGGPHSAALLGTSQASQIGSNTTTLTQSASIRSGDAVAGSTTSAGGATASAQGFSVVPIAASGPAVGANAATVGSGPDAGTPLIGGGAQQSGSNTTTVAQSTTTRSGNVTAGSVLEGALAFARQIPGPPRPAQRVAILAALLLGSLAAATLWMPRAATARSRPIVLELDRRGHGPAFLQSVPPLPILPAALDEPETERVTPAELATALRVPLFTGHVLRDDLAHWWGDARHVDLTDPKANLPSPLETGRSVLVFTDAAARPVAVWAA